MLDKLVSNPILFYSVFSIACILLFLVIFIIVSRIRKYCERRKLKNTSEIILNEHYEKPSESSLEEEINKLEEKAKQNVSPVVESFEETDANKFIKSKPIQIEINSEITNENKPNNDKSYDMESILSRMQEDLTKRDEKQILQFEQDQEKEAIISYKELLKANGKDEPSNIETSKFDLAEFFESMTENSKNSYSLNNINEAEDLSVITIDENIEPKLDIRKEINEFKNNINSNTQVSKIEVDAPKENTKFKMSEFISPVYGRMEPKLNYPTIPNLDEKQKSISQLDDEEFLSVLKAFRQNL